MGPCLSAPHAYLSSHPAFQGSGSPRLCPQCLFTLHTVLRYSHLPTWLAIHPNAPSYRPWLFLRHLLRCLWAPQVACPQLNSGSFPSSAASLVILTLPLSHTQDRVQHRAVPCLSLPPAQGFLGLFLQQSKEACGYLLGLCLKADRLRDYKGNQLY